MTSREAAVGAGEADPVAETTMTTTMTTTTMTAVRSDY
jgi:hypothetical protein